MFAYVLSFAFLADGSGGSSDSVVQDDSVGVQGNDMVVKKGCHGRRSIQSEDVVFVGNSLNGEDQVCGWQTRSRREV